MTRSGCPEPRAGSVRRLAAHPLREVARPGSPLCGRRREPDSADRRSVGPGTPHDGRSGHTGSGLPPDGRPAMTPVPGSRNPDIEPRAEGWLRMPAPCRAARQPPCRKAPAISRSRASALFSKRPSARSELRLQWLRVDSIQCPADVRQLDSDRLGAAPDLSGPGEALVRLPVSYVKPPAGWRAAQGSRP